MSAVTRLGRIALMLSAALLTFGSLPQPAAGAEWPNSLGLKASYDVAARIEWSNRRLTVDTTIRVTNTTDRAIEEMTFNLLPMQIAEFRLVEASAGNVHVQPTIDEHNLSLDLPTALAVGQQTTIRISYRAWFRSTLGGSSWMFGKASKIATAYRWIPWLTKRSQFTHVGDPNTTGFATQVDVAITTDRPLVIATTGRLVSRDGLTQRFRAQNVIDFNFTASPAYRLTTMQVGNVAVRLYTRALAPDEVAEWAERALRQFDRLVGPYPYATLSIAETPGGAAIKSPGHIWIPGQSGPGVLPYRVVHEVAHQWFYAGVANNQPWEPFADEAVAEFLSRDLLGHRQPRCDQARLDGSVYDYGTSCYYDVIYTQGDRYLVQYRSNVGDSAFWQGLRKYYADFLFRRGGSGQLLDALDAASGWTAGHADRFPSLY